MLQAPTKETRTQREPSPIKANFNLNLPEANLIPEVRQGVMINPEVAATIKTVMVQEIKKEVDLATEMTDLSPRTDLNPKSRAATDVANQTMISKIATSRKRRV